MKNACFILSILIILTSCVKKKEVLDKKKVKSEVVVISGVIENSLENHFMIIGKQINHKVNLNNDGSFLDTLAVEVVTTNGLKIHNKQVPIYLKNGYRLNINLNINDFPNSIKYSGLGAKENQYLLAQYKYGLDVGNIGNISLFSLEEKEFLAKIEQSKRGLDSINDLYKDIDINLLDLTKKQNIKSLGFVKNLYETSKDAIKKQKEALKKLTKGTPSPTFNNYLDLNGNFVSLNDFKGTYVYIDIWGTWIRNYTDKAATINRFKEKHLNKNIKFITLCADNRASSGTISYAKQKWMSAIKKHNLFGTHLFVGNDREFLKNYYVVNLPRFILIDPKGKIIDANAPAPYDAEIKTLFNTLKLK